MDGLSRSWYRQGRHALQLTTFSNGVAERWVGSVRRDLLDHVIVLNQRHLRRLLKEYIRYYHEDRTHLGLGKDTPVGRVAASVSLSGNKIISWPRLGGLHHRYRSPRKSLQVVDHLPGLIYARFQGESQLPNPIPACQIAADASRRLCPGFELTAPTTAITTVGIGSRKRSYFWRTTTSPIIRSLWIPQLTSP